MAAGMGISLKKRKKKFNSEILLELGICALGQRRKRTEGEEWAAGIECTWRKQMGRSVRGHLHAIEGETL